jgi:hypothetical protein
LIRYVPLAIALILAGAAVAAPYRAPRTPDGQPDLQGLWTNASLTRLERPAEFDSVVVPDAKARAFEAGQTGRPKLPGDDVGGAETEWWEMGAKLARLHGQVRSAWIFDPVSGRLPYTDAGRKALADFNPGMDGPEARPTTDRCLEGVGTPAGPPMLNTNYNNNYQIVQAPGHVAIVVEMNHDVRIIRLGERAKPSPIRTWMGESVGHWDGETLVVETANLHSAQSVHGSRSIGLFYASPDALVRERFTRVSASQILYEFTVEDPATFSRPWRAEMLFAPAKGPMYEFACHEGNYAMTSMLAGARQAEAAARDAAATPGQR